MPIRALIMILFWITLRHEPRNRSLRIRENARTMRESWSRSVYVEGKETMKRGCHCLQDSHYSRGLYRSCHHNLMFYCCTEGGCDNEYYHSVVPQHPSKNIIMFTTVYIFNHFQSAIIHIHIILFLPFSNCHSQPVRKAFHSLLNGERMLTLTNCSWPNASKTA